MQPELFQHHEGYVCIGASLRKSVISQVSPPRKRATGIRGGGVKRKESDNLDGFGDLGALCLAMVGAREVSRNPVRPFNRYAKSERSIRFPESVLYIPPVCCLRGGLLLGKYRAVGR